MSSSRISVPFSLSWRIAAARGAVASTKAAAKEAVASAKAQAQEATASASAKVAEEARLRRETEAKLREARAALATAEREKERFRGMWADADNALIAAQRAGYGR